MYRCKITQEKYSSGIGNPWKYIKLIMFITKEVFKSDKRSKFCIVLISVTIKYIYRN